MLVLGKIMCTRTDCRGFSFFFFLIFFMGSFSPPLYTPIPTLSFLHLLPHWNWFNAVTMPCSKLHCKLTRCGGWAPDPIHKCIIYMSEAILRKYAWKNKKMFKSYPGTLLIIWFFFFCRWFLKECLIVHISYEVNY